MNSDVESILNLFHLQQNLVMTVERDPAYDLEFFHLLEFLQLSDALLFIVTKNREKGLAMGFLRYEYLGPEVLAGFDTYKYSCRDTSPLSNYVMHPFWNQCVKVII